MKNICAKCKIEMVGNCNVTAYGNNKVMVSKKTKGFFIDVYDDVKAAVCPTCGCVAFYIENFKSFSD